MVPSSSHAGRLELLPVGATPFRANLHCHTTISDGGCTPEEVKAHYLAHGYSIVAFTDHEAFCAHLELTDERFLAISAYEVSFTEGGDRAWVDKWTHHINLLAPEPEPKVLPYSTPANDWSMQFYKRANFDAKGYKVLIREHTADNKSIQKILNTANKLGWLATYNHPDWSNQLPTGYQGLKGLWGIECYNGANRLGWELDNTPMYLHEYLLAGRNVYPVAADDNHNEAGERLGWNVVFAERLDYNSVFRALKAGHHYASTGPSITALWFDNGILHVESPDGCTAVLSTNCRVRSRVVVAPDERLVANFDIRGFIADIKSSPVPFRNKPFVRISVYDRHRNWAITPGYWIEDLVPELKGA